MERNQVFTWKGTIVPKVSQLLPIQKRNRITKHLDYVVILRGGRPVISCGIEATVILSKQMTEGYDGFLWPLKKHKRDKPQDIIVFYDKKTLISSYKLGKEAVRFKKKFNDKLYEIEFEYFRPITRRNEGL